MKEAWTKQRSCVGRLLGFHINKPVKLGGFIRKSKSNCIHFLLANLAKFGTWNEAHQ